jgi:hypothetical protein
MTYSVWIHLILAVFSVTATLILCGYKYVREVLWWLIFAIILPFVPVLILLFMIRQPQIDPYLSWEEKWRCILKGESYMNLRRRKCLLSRMFNPTLSPHPHNAPYRGGFNEPYCSEACFRQGGEIISNEFAKRSSRMCALCDKYTTLGIHNAGVIYLNACSGNRITIIDAPCAEVAKDILSHYTKCSICKKDIDTKENN